MTRVERQILKNQIIIMKGISMNFKDYHNEHNKIRRRGGKIICLQMDLKLYMITKNTI